MTADRMLSIALPAHDAERAARAAAGLCRDCGRPTVAFEDPARPAGQCWVSGRSYSCKVPLFEDGTPPHAFIRDNQDVCHVCGQGDGATIHNGGTR